MRCSLRCEIKLNSGGVGVVQGVIMTAFIFLMRLLGQSDNGCGMMLRLSLSGGFVEIHGKFWHSPSNCASCCVVDANFALWHACCFVEVKGEFWHSSSNCAICFVIVANVALGRACSFHFCNSCWGTLMIHRFRTSGVVGIVLILGGSLAWGMLGQLNDGCGMMSRLSLSGGFV